MDSANHSFGKPRLGEPVVASNQAQTVHRFHVTDTAIRCVSSRGREQEGQQFLQELETLHHHAQVMGELLGMKRIVHGMKSSDTQTVAFRFRDQAVEDEDVMGLLADGRMQCSEVDQQLRRA